MDKTIEVCLASKDGVIDCMLEPNRSDDDFFYSATILYPEMVNGYGRSEIFCCNLRKSSTGKEFVFENREDIHPKILKLEREISDAVIAAKER